MLRTSRRGLADLIVMIVLIVFLVGMSALAFFTYDKARSEREYLARLRQIPARQSAELDATRARYAELSSHIGFKGNGEYSSHVAIKEMLQRGQNYVADYYSVTASEPTNRDAMKSTDSSTVKGTSQNKAKVYDYDGGMTLLAAIGAADNVITQIVGSATPGLRTLRDTHRTWRQEAADRLATETAAKYAELRGTAEAADREVAGAFGRIAQAEETLANNLREEYAAYAALDSQEIRDQREATFALQRELAQSRASSGEAQRDYRLKADRRRFDDTRDADGEIFLVDEVSGYVWINIGQQSDVRLNQTFQVIRPDPARGSDRSIGEIRVKEVIRGNVARCRVDALDGDGVYPRKGDMIRNPTFSARQYSTFALAGKFGGSNTKHTRLELVEMLQNLGYRVVSRIDGATDAVIVGGDWADDAAFKAAKEAGLRFETYTEQELLWFLGYSGPDRR